MGKTREQNSTAFTNPCKFNRENIFAKTNRVFFESMQDESFSVLKIDAGEYHFEIIYRIRYSRLKEKIGFVKRNKCYRVWKVISR